ncbi:Interferon-activable protein 205-B [Lemmus lemmus]
MVNEYKRIFLLKGLANMSSDQFDCFKSLMSSDLRLERNMQERYTRVQIADMMENEFPNDAGLGKLIDFCEAYTLLKDLLKHLKKKNQKVKERKTLGKKRQEAGSAVPTSTTSNTLASDGGQTATAQVSLGNSGGLAVHRGSSRVSCPYFAHQKRKTMNEEKPEVKKTKMSKGSDCPASPGEATVRCQTPGPQISSSTLSNSSLAKNQKTQTPSQSATRGAVGQNDAMTVKVLSATEPFKYESKEHGENSMFHGTVATVSEYFHVKVFNINLKEKFTKGNVIIISNYVKFRGILEIKKDSFVVNADPKQKIEVPNKLIRRANETPKISDIHKGISGALFYGLFTLYKVILENLFFAFFFLTFLSQHLVYGHSILNAPDLIYTNTWNQIG